MYVCIYISGEKNKTIFKIPIIFGHVVFLKSFYV